MAVTLVTGGVRSGKSRYAEHLMRDAPQVTVVATGAPPGLADAEWAARVSRHRHDRPEHWETLETLELVAILDRGGPAVIVDCLGAWVARLVDEAGLWHDLPAASELVASHRDALVDALSRTGRDVVLVTNEVGLGLLGDAPSGRFFQDELGRLNAAVADVANHVRLVVAGRVIDLDRAPAVPHLTR
jgi:adenosylcobinamide kinase/adenosylcobinamide-phosphate guanylyltransferase